MFENVRADIEMAYEQSVGTSKWDRRVQALCRPGTLAVRSLRFCHAIRSVRLPVLRQLGLIPVLLVRGLSQVLTGVHMSSNARIGPGFVIHTGCGVFIPPTTIGARCSVQTGVVLGYGVRRIGNDVVIGAGAKVVGPISVGNNVIIAPNSLVVADVPDNSTVAGVPARLSVGRSISTLIAPGAKTNGRDHGAAEGIVVTPEPEGVPAPGVQRRLV